MVRKAIKIKYPLVFVVCFSVMFGGVSLPTAHAFSDQIIQRGATGDDVVELQARLQYIGFYNGKIDGVYGWGTYWAVRNYQNEFGLKIDGLVGPQMKNMLERSTSYDKEFVQRAINEGRAFTHYGGVPLHIQKGEKGTKGQGRWKQGASPPQGGAPSPGASPPQGGAPSPGASPPPGEAPSPGASPPQGGAPSPGASPPQGGAPSPGASPPPGEAPSPGASPPQGGAPEPGAAPDPEVTPQQPAETPELAEPPAPQPEAEPVPYEEVPEEQDDQPTIEKAMNVPSGFSDNDIQLMAQCVYAEAKGEPYIGMVAVAAVILNRVNSPDFPNTVSEVIFEPRAFEPVANGEIYNQPSDDARRAVMDAMNGQDPTGHALYFFNPGTAKSPWVWSRPQIKTIGKHLFAK